MTYIHSMRTSSKTMNYNQESLMLTCSRKTGPDSMLVCSLTGYWDSSFRVLILPRYIGIYTAIIPVPSSRRITSSKFEGSNSGLSSSVNPSLPASLPVSQFDVGFINLLFQSSTTEGSSDISATSSTTSDTSCSCSSGSSRSSPTKPSSNSSEQPLYTQSHSAQIPSPERFLDIQSISIRTSTPKPSLDMLSDSDKDVDSSSP
ncbi:hypothetical protein EAF04_006849 [Stromatinia cepivora]|nr:hypothetical protein EAF04_006849 [Stromatinia cepivora]